YAWVQAKVGETDFTIEQFVELFPPVAVYQSRISSDDYLKGETNGTSHKHISLEEMVMLFLSNENPAFQPYIELFDDTLLEQRTRYPEILKHIEEYFRSQPRFGPQGQTLLA